MEPACFYVFIWVLSAVILNDSFTSEDPDQVGSFRYQDLEEVARTSRPVTLGSKSLIFVFFLWGVGEGYGTGSEDDAKVYFWPGDMRMWP